MPAIHVNITSSVDQPPTATITVPADSRLFDVGKNDRVPVHIFQRETYALQESFILLFEGFITDRAYLNLASQRDITFNCVGSLDILNDLRIEFMHRFDDMYRVAVNGKPEIARQKPEAIGFPLCFLLKGLSPNGTQVETLQYAYQYLLNVYQYMAGPEASIDWDTGESRSLSETTYHEQSSKLSEYFARQAKYFNILHRFAKVPYFDEPSAAGDDMAVWPDSSGGRVFPLLRSVQTHAMVEYLGSQLMTQQASIQTARDLIDVLAEPMEFEFANFSSPAYHAGDPEQKGVYEKSDRLVSSCLKPMLCDSIPPMCNVIFRSQVLQIEAQDSFKGSATRIQVMDINSPLAQLAKEGDAHALVELALTTLYPLYDIDKNSLLDPTINRIASYMLDTEEFTGPWVRQVGTPMWWQWADALGTGASGDGTKVKQMLCHRQLLLAKYMNHHITVETTFNPYITPGFPGVVFDSKDTGFAFAGYVLAVSHSISPDEGGMVTRVEMNYVRQLEEAAVRDIVHPVEAIQKLLHNEERMTKIYDALLGVIPTDKNNLLPLYGTSAHSYASLLERYSDITYAEHDPQNDPVAAYAVQRRNICTFDQYLKFMGLQAELGTGVAGTNVPVGFSAPRPEGLAEGQPNKDDYISYRRKVSIFVKKLVHAGGDSDTVTVNDTAAAAATKAGSGTAQVQEQPKKDPNLIQPKRETRTEVATPQEDEDRSKAVRTVIVREERDLRDLLREVSAEAFSKQIYA